jgi:hypothetical protein
MGRLRAPHLAVVDCAYGCEKEDQDETDEIKKAYRQKVDADEEAG